MSFVDSATAASIQKNPVDTKAQSNDPRYQVSATINLNGANLPDVTVKEVIVGESLLNPSAHVAVTLQSAMFYTTASGEFIDWDQFRCKPININISDTEGNRTMVINQTVYRCDNRRFTNTNTGNTEDLTLHAIDQTILNDAGMVWGKTWKCATPGSIVKEALNKIGAKNSEVANNTGPGRPYSADSLHPLQVIQQQSNVALGGNGDDPSFLHYMTIKEQTGENIHHFRSLYDLMNVKGHTPYEIFASDVGISGERGFAEAYSGSFASAAQRTAVTFTFPCDYDVLSDILNGVDCEGQNKNDGRFFNLASGDFGAAMGAVSSAANLFGSMTNKGTAQQQQGCETNVEKYLLKRQARMALLERDKTALRVTLPWSPWLHVGGQIMFNWKNRYNSNTNEYGHGRYLITSLTHNIQFGGYATTTLDCITNTFGVPGG